MIITKLRLQEEHPMAGLSDTWPLPSCDLNLDLTAGENGYILRDAAGLSPPSLTAVVEGFDITGIPILGSVAEKRDLVFKIDLNPGLGQSYSSLRDDMYKLIDRSLIINLMNDAIIVAQTRGHIREFDVAHFTNQPQIDMTIECEDGEFSSPTAVHIPFSDIYTSTPVINYDNGTAPTGLELEFYVTASPGVSGFTISNHSRFWHPGTAEVENEFEVIFPFLHDDLITISTQPKDKRITLVRGVTHYDLAGYISKGAVWPKLYSGVNVFSWTFSSSWMSWTKASYIPKYWGV